MKIRENQIKTQALEAVQYAKKQKTKPLKHNASAYGVALKYIFALRDWQMKDASAMAGMSPQSLNYIVNIQSSDRFDPIYIRKLCDKFGVDSAYFVELVGEIQSILEA